MASAFESAAHPSPDPQCVAKIFAKQYYDVLLQSPEHAYKFYKDSSVVTWPASDGTSVVTATTTTEKIQELIMSEDYDGCQVVVETVDGHPSQSDGVIVMVTGTWTNKKASRSFSQTFFLANNGRGGSYYVLNDMFRFVDLQEPPAAADDDDLIPTDGNKVVSAPSGGDHAVVSTLPAVVVEEQIGVSKVAEPLIFRSRLFKGGFLTIKWLLTLGIIII